MKLKIFPYSKKFEEKFKKEKKRISKILKDCEIYHIGSTAVSGLGGKGIIDIMIGIKSFKDAKSVIKKLNELGFTHIHPKEKGRVFLSKDPKLFQKNVHIHITKIGSKAYKELLFFRDYLRKNKEEAKNYNNLKIKWLKESNADRKKYKNLKSKYINKILKKNETMFIPKVKFTNASVSYDINWFYHFLFKHRWDWSKYVIKRHPKIEEVKSFEKENERVNFLKKYINNFWKKNKVTINKNKSKYQKEWRKIEKEFFEFLSELMQINWPKNRKTIKAMMSICPICPRFLNDWSFSAFYNFDIKNALKVIMHECCHFLYFEKWKKMYPKADRKTFETPHIEWHLSELAAPIIINDKRVQKLLKQKASFYKEHSKIKIGKKTAPQFFTEIYNRNINKENGFELFLKEAYKQIKKHKKLFT